MRERMPTRKGQRPLLTSEEAALWAQVSQTITPRKGRDAPALPLPKPVEPLPKLTMRLSDGDLRNPVAIVQSPLPPLGPLEKRLRQKLGRGKTDVDRVLDLHGMRAHEAHQALRHFILCAQKDGLRLVLVITGKGGRGAGFTTTDTGVLRRNVPHWLREPEMRSLIIGFEEATQTHGGEGALYVRIRRMRA
jgi:DNA-nicking Smr family endonuclease